MSPLDLLYGNRKRPRVDSYGMYIMDSIEFLGTPAGQDLQAMEQAGKELAQKLDNSAPDIKNLVAGLFSQDIF